MTDYNLAGLSTRSFEQLIQAIALKVVSPGVVVFGDGADGGREATFNGLTRYPSEDHPWNGYIVIQAKFRQRPQNSQEDGEWALKQLKSELKDFANPKKRRRQPDYYIFATNVVLTPVQDKGTKDKADDIFQEFKDSVPLKGYDIWDYDKIRVFLDNFEDIRRAYASFITPGDVLSQIMDFIEPRKELFADQYTNPEDIEVLVQKVRSHFDKTIQNECETLCTFNLLYSPMRGNLSQIYVQTKLNESQKFSSEEFSQERRLWEDVVRKNPKLMVLGKPGAGKTTLLQYIAVHCDEVDFKSKLIPVFISLKTLAENAKRADEISLIRYIRKKYCRSHISEKELEVLLDNGRLLFLLDGLDEVTEEKIRAVVKEIHHLVDEYGENRVIVSCRKEYQAYKSKAFGNFTLSKVADFEQLQIDKFISNWFAESKENTQTSKEILANNLIVNLKLEKNKRILELADTPLLLHLICLIFRERGDLPPKRVDIYKEGIDLLLEKWNQFNDRVRINVSELRKALRQIAVITFEEGKSFFKEEKFLPLINNSSRILSDIEVISGLLINKRWKTYAFSHKTFQEYLIAEELLNCQQGWRKILTHIGESRWHEICLLMFEILPNTDDLLRLFKQGFQKLKIEYFLEDEDEDELDIYDDYKPPTMSDENFQSFLIQGYQKAMEEDINYKLASVRVFYLGCSILLTGYFCNRESYFGSWTFSIYTFIEISQFIDENIFRFHEPHKQLINYIDNVRYLLIIFDIASQLTYWNEYGWRNLSTDEYSDEDSYAYILISELDNRLVCVPNIYKGDTILPRQLCIFEQKELDKYTIPILKIPDNVLVFIQELKEIILIQKCQEVDSIKKWWVKEGEIWLENFRNVIAQYCHLGLKEWLDFDGNDFEVLHNYCLASRLLVDSLNISQVSSEVRAVIEDNLFLPLDSSSS
jgi:hypothetical protein